MGIPTSLAKAKRLAVYWDNYVEYLSSVDDRQPGIGTGDPRPPQTELFFKPFGVDIDTNQYVSANGTADRWTSYQAQFVNHTKETINVGTETVLYIPMSPARVVIKTGVSTSKQVVTAKTTKRKYITYGGKSGSIPFGQQSDTDEELAIFTNLRTALRAIVDNNTVKISRTKEKI